MKKNGKEGKYFKKLTFNNRPIFVNLFNHAICSTKKMLSVQPRRLSDIKLYAKVRVRGVILFQFINFLWKMH